MATKDRDKADIRRVTPSAFPGAAYDIIKPTDDGDAEVVSFDRLGKELNRAVKPAPTPKPKTNSAAD